MHNTNSNTSERGLWLVGSALILGSSIWLQSVFWYQAASNDAIRAAHLAVGVATTVVYLAATCSATISFATSRPGRGIVAALAAATSCALAILCQSGTYSYSEAQLAGKSRQAETLLADQHAHRDAVERDAESARAALSAQAAGLQGQIDETQKQIDAMVARGMVTKANDARPALNALITQQSALAAQAAAIRGATDAPVTAAPPIDDGPFGALFKTLSDFSGRPASQLRAWFLLILPVLHEFWLGAGTIMLTSTLSGTRREEVAEEEMPEEAVLNVSIPKPQRKTLPPAFDFGSTSFTPGKSNGSIP